MPVSSESSRNLLDFLNDLEEKVMWQRNNGQAREELQIKFTGYLIQAVRRTQRDYLKALYAYSNQETLTDTIFAVSQTLEQEVIGSVLSAVLTPAVERILKNCAGPVQAPTPTRRQCCLRLLPSRI